MADLSSLFSKAQYFKALLGQYWYDARRFDRHRMRIDGRAGDRQLRGRLLQKAHSIEKGLSLPDIRLGFGDGAFAAIEQCLPLVRARAWAADDTALKKLRGALSRYVDLHRDRGRDELPNVGRARRILEALPGPGEGGTISLERTDVQSRAQGDFAALALSRHSLRIFAPGAPDRAAILDAVALAGRSPSVCNRQSGRVHLVTDARLSETILKIQGGNSGFTDQIRGVLIVTADLSVFETPGERNQCYVDGGLFAMSLLYALHYKGVGACSLNWSATAAKDMALRAAVRLPDEETVIMLIGIGAMPERFHVAASPRLPAWVLLTEIGPDGRPGEAAAELPSAAGRDRIAGAA